MFSGALGQNKHTFVPFLPRNLRSESHKLALVTMLQALHTQITNCEYFCSTDSSPFSTTQHLEIYVETNKLQTGEVHELDSSTSHDCPIKILKLILNVASSVYGKVADGLL